MSDYMSLRQVSAKDYDYAAMPGWLLPCLPKEKDALLVDIGCGFGQLLRGCKEHGYTNLMGFDCNEGPLSVLQEHGIPTYLNMEDLLCERLAERLPGKARVIFLHHVLEHIPKKDVITFLKNIKMALGEDGVLSVNVPNAQAHTGCYWAYEDFTHETLFTGGSLIYVLKAAGFESVDFLDPDCLWGLSGFARRKRKFFLRLYKKNMKFWNKVTGSAFHAPSPRIFSYEVKAIAR